MPDGARTDRQVKATGTALDLLEAIAARNGAGVTELAEATGYSKGTVHHHLATLKDRGYLITDADTYHIGLPFLTLGGEARRRAKLYTTAKAAVDRLSEETGEDAQLAVEENGTGYYVYQSPADGRSPGLTHLGTQLELHSTAVGKALLSQFPADTVTDVLEETELTSHTNRTTTDPDALRDELDEIEDEGVAFDDREHLDAVRCVAAPITAGGVRGAISVSGPASGIDDDLFRDELPEHVQNAATVVEINAQYAEWMADS
jgi:DNA-binding IclR family transcriptional regulator